MTEKSATMTSSIIPLLFQQVTPTTHLYSGRNIPFFVFPVQSSHPHQTNQLKRHFNKLIRFLKIGTHLEIKQSKCSRIN